MFRSDGDRRSFSLTRDITVIGRREDCDLRIPLGDVSRKHCRLVRDGDALRLEDLGSSNGTYHNGQRVQEAILSPGDSIQVGPLVFVLQIDGVPADDELAPVETQTGTEGQEALPDDASFGAPAGAAGLQELPTIDDGLDELQPAEGYEPAQGAPELEALPEVGSLPELEPAAELEPISELEPASETEPATSDDLGFDMLDDDALETPHEKLSLEDEQGHEHEQPHH